MGASVETVRLAATECAVVHRYFVIGIFPVGQHRPSMQPLHFAIIRALGHAAGEQASVKLIHKTLCRTLDLIFRHFSHWGSPFGCSNAPTFDLLNLKKENAVVKWMQQKIIDNVGSGWY